MAARILAYRGIAPRIHESAFIAPGATIIGDVEIGAEASVWHGCVLRGDVNRIVIGARSNIQDGTVVHVESDPGGGDYRETGGGLPTVVGEGVTVGHLALLHACTVGDGALIGMGSIAMDGAIVEAGGFLAAGALLPPGKRLPSGELWGGRPGPAHARPDREGGAVDGLFCRALCGAGAEPQTRGAGGRVMTSAGAGRGAGPPQAPLRIGIAGIGTVGSALVRLLAQNSEHLDRHSERPLSLRAVSSRSRERAAERAEIDDYAWVDDPAALAAHPELDAVVELIGGGRGRGSGGRARGLERGEACGYRQQGAPCRPRGRAGGDGGGGGGQSLL